MIETLLDTHGLPPIARLHRQDIAPKNAAKAKHLLEKQRNIPESMLETERKYLLNASIEDQNGSLRNLDKELGALAQTEGSGWQYQGLFNQCIISPDYIPKTRLRIISNPDAQTQDDRLRAFVTFKGTKPASRNPSEKVHPRFEIDLPIDLRALANMYGMPADEALHQLTDYAGYGMVRKKRYTHTAASGDIKQFDVDLLQFGDKKTMLKSIGTAAKAGASQAIESARNKGEEISPKAQKRLIKEAKKSACERYQNLAIMDAELADGSRIITPEDIPEALRAFARHGDEPLHEISTDSRFKGRNLSSLIGRSGQTRIDANTCNMLGELAPSCTQIKH